MTKTVAISIVLFLFSVGFCAHTNICDVFGEEMREGVDGEHSCSGCVFKQCTLSQNIRM